MANLENIKRGQTVTEQINMINENVNNINEEVNDLVDNKAGYITSEDIPVTSVNNQTGNVSLQAKDVGAFPNSSTIQEFDLNNIKETGLYVGTYATNPYYLVVIKYNDTYIYQELIGSKFKEYRRFTGVWSEWVKEYSTENPVKASEISGIEVVDADKELNLALLEDTTFVKANIKYNPIAQRLYIGDKEFATIDYVDKAVNMIKSLIVTQLPDVGVANTIYFVPAGEESGNSFMEYVYINGSWEIVGGTSIDLTPFLTKSEAEETFAKISSLDSKVSKTTTINGKSLENNITLTAEDVGALSKDTQVSNDVVHRYTNSQIAEKLSAGEIVANDVILPIDDGAFLKGHIYLYDGTNLNEISNNVDLETDQSISGIKNFTGALRYGGESVATETDLENKVSITRTINGKSLSSDITLTATDVGALPDTTIIPTDYVSVNEQTLTDEQKSQVKTNLGIEESTGGATITLNGAETTDASFYAPTSGGTSGYLLISGGKSAPTWRPSRSTRSGSVSVSIPANSSATANVSLGTFNNIVPQRIIRAYAGTKNISVTISSVSTVLTNSVPVFLHNNSTSEVSGSFTITFVYSDV